jgi:membrane protease YdiL (CAAX protease family)
VIPFLIGLLVNSFILSALYVKTNNLWICVMTHSLINVFSQLVTGSNQYVGYFSKVVIIVIAIMLATKTIRKQVDNCANANT